MNHYYLFQVFVILALLISSMSSQPLDYDELNEDDKTKSSSNDEQEEISDFDTRLSKLTDDDANLYDDDNRSYDSYEEKQFHQRAILSSSRASHTISPHTRQAIIDILQKAIDQGWRPNLKHYIPATRFGRHRR